ncbi:hypothetical protein [Runella sp.]
MLLDNGYYSQGYELGRWGGQERQVAFWPNGTEGHKAACAGFQRR